MVAIVPWVILAPFAYVPKAGRATGVSIPLPIVTINLVVPMVRVLFWVTATSVRVNRVGMASSATTTLTIVLWGLVCTARALTR